MPKTQYLKVLIDGVAADVESIDNFPISISMNIEDESNFQEKKSTEAINCNFPASQINSGIFESYEKAEVEQKKANEFMPVSVVAGGTELLKGKLLLKSGSSRDGKSQTYNADLFGANADWLIDLAETTLFNFLNQETHIFSKTKVIASWAYDGTDELNDFVYAPVRYSKPFSDSDKHVRLLDMRPSISKYWIIYRAFKSLGYKIESAFFDSEFFRRQVMPWVWGEFAYIKNEKLRFRATGTPSPDPNPDSRGSSVFAVLYPSFSTNLFILGQAPSGADFSVNTWDMAHDIPPLGFDNGVSGAFPMGNYYYDGSGGMVWTYLPDVGLELGTIDVTFKLTYNYYLPTGSGGEKRYQIRYKINGGAFTIITLEAFISSGDHRDRDVVKYIDVPGLNGGDVVTFQLWGYNSNNAIISSFSARGGAGGSGDLELPPKVTILETFSFKKTNGSIVDFTKHEGFKNHKFLDFLRGVVDEYNLTIQTDSINKIVRIEPTFDYYLDNDPSIKSEGYFTSKKLDWTNKLDQSVSEQVEQYSDYERIMNFRKKEDGNNGGRKRWEEANKIEAGASKFAFNKRFKSGESELKNRFFGEVMHVFMESWRNEYDPSNTVSPQIPAFIPENIANTSAITAESTFAPCSAYYAGADGVNGLFKFENDIVKCPLMFSVYYGKAGQFYPSLTYSDQLSNGVLIHGLLRKFYLNRLAMMQSGKRLRASFFLQNGDVVSPFIRERIAIRGNDYYLFSYQDYTPLLSNTTSCFFWKVDYPKLGIDSNIYPSNLSVTSGELADGDDTPYAELLILQSELTNE